MKPKNDITTNFFHDEYAKEFGQFGINTEKSRRIYAKIIRLLFEFVKEQLYQGAVFTTPFGFFQITKVHLNPRSERKYVSHAASKLEGKIVYRSKKQNYFHKLTFVVQTNMQDRYYFRPLQGFVRKIHKYYD